MSELMLHAPTQKSLFEFEKGNVVWKTKWIFSLMLFFSCFCVISTFIHFFSVKFEVKYRLFQMKFLEISCDLNDK